MKKLKLFILAFIFTLLPVASNAQQMELVQGITISSFGIGGAQYDFTVFESAPALGYNVGFNFWIYPNKLSPIMLSAHLFYQKGSVAYFHDSNLEEYETSVFIDTRYLVFGLQPYTFKALNKQLEIALAIELAFLIQDRSIGHENFAPTLFPMLSSYYVNRNTIQPIKDVGIFGKLSIGYAFDIGNTCQFIPRLTFRIADLKDPTIVGNERSIGLELGFRF